MFLSAKDFCSEIGFPHPELLKDLEAEGDNLIANGTPEELEAGIKKFE